MPNNVRIARGNETNVGIQLSIAVEALSSEETTCILLVIWLTKTDPHTSCHLLNRTHYNGDIVAQ